MRRKKSKKRKMIEFIVFVLCVVAVILFRNYYKKETDNILQKGEYSIGTVVVFSGSKPTIHAPNVVNQPGQAQSIKYDYTVNGKKYTITYDAKTGNVPREGVKIGEKYLIKYLKNSPKKSRMLFNYPIKDSTDFKRYVNQLSK